MKEVLEKASEKMHENIESQSMTTEKLEKGFKARYKARFSNGLEFKCSGSSSVSKESAIKHCLANARTAIKNIFIYVEYERDRIDKKKLDEEPAQRINRTLTLVD